MTDIFDFWSKIERGAHVHPADVKTFDRMDAKRHGFQLECLPGCFGGRLKAAPIVLLYLSPGFGDSDIADAESEGGKITAFEAGKAMNRSAITGRATHGWRVEPKCFATMKR